MHFQNFRYVYKFVCDPEALFQMALAENHRAALKMEATSGTFPTSGSSSRAAAAETITVPGRNRHQVNKFPFMLDYLTETQ